MNGFGSVNSITVLSPFKFLFVPNAGFLNPKKPSEIISFVCVVKNSGIKKKLMNPGPATSIFETSFDLFFKISMTIFSANSFGFCPTIFDKTKAIFVE